MILSLVFALAMNTNHSLNDVSKIIGVVGKTLEEGIHDLGLKKESFRLGGGFDNEILQYCSLLDENKNLVYLWLDVKDVKLPHSLFSSESAEERLGIFNDHLKSKITFVSVINMENEGNPLKATPLPPLNTYSGKQVKDVLNSLALNIKSRVGFDDKKNPVFLIRVIDERRLVFEFQIPKDGPGMSGITKKEINFENLANCKFSRLRVYTGAEKEKLRRLIIDLSGRFR